MQYGFLERIDNMKKQTYNWKKTAQKAVRVGAYVVVLGLIAFVTEQPGLLILAPILEGARDYLKHKDD